MNTLTRERKKWHRLLKQLWKDKPQFCEFRFSGCNAALGLTPAHSMKRRFIRTKADYFEIGIACLNCHRILDEKMTHEEMRQAVLNAIHSRTELRDY